MGRKRMVPQPITPEPRLGFRIGELAEKIGVCRTTIWRSVKRGDIRTVHVGPTAIITVDELRRIGLLQE